MTDNETEFPDEELVRRRADEARAAEKEIGAIWPGWRVSVAWYGMEGRFHAYLDRDRTQEEESIRLGPTPSISALIDETRYAREEWRLRRIASLMAKELAAELRAALLGGGR